MPAKLVGRHFGLEQEATRRRGIATALAGFSVREERGE